MQEFPIVLDGALTGICSSEHPAMSTMLFSHTITFGYEITEKITFCGSHEQALSVQLPQYYTGDLQSVYGPLGRRWQLMRKQSRVCCTHSCTAVRLSRACRSTKWQCSSLLQLVIFPQKCIAVSLVHLRISAWGIVFNGMIRKNFSPTLDSNWTQRESSRVLNFIFVSER